LPGAGYPVYYQLVRGDFWNRQGSPEKLYFFFNEDSQGKPDAVSGSAEKQSRIPDR